jgi:hypothetical protein
MASTSTHYCKSGSAVRRLCAGVSALALGMAGCAATTPAPPPEVSLSELFVSDTDLLASLFRSAASTPLSVHPLCAELTGPGGSRTMARYIAAILAEHGPDTPNWLAIDISRNARLGSWQVTVLPLRGAEEDPQIWGLEFHIAENDGLLLPDSLRCHMAWEGWW